MNCKGSDWIRLEFAHPFPMNSEAPIASANFISDGKVQVSPYLAIWGCFIIHTHEGACPTNGAPLFKTNGWAQSSPYPVRPFKSLLTFHLRTMQIKHD